MGPKPEGQIHAISAVLLAVTADGFDPGGSVPVQELDQPAALHGEVLEGTRDLAGQAGAARQTDRRHAVRNAVGARERVWPTARPADDRTRREVQVVDEFDIVVDPVKPGSVGSWIGETITRSIDGDQPNPRGARGVDVRAHEARARHAMKQDDRPPSEIAPLAEREGTSVRQRYRAVEGGRCRHSHHGHPLMTEIYGCTQVNRSRGSSSTACPVALASRGARASDRRGHRREQADRRGRCRTRAGGGRPRRAPVWR